MTDRADELRALAAKVHPTVACEYGGDVPPYPLPDSGLCDACADLLDFQIEQHLAEQVQP